MQQTTRKPDEGLRGGVEGFHGQDAAAVRVGGSGMSGRAHVAEQGWKTSVIVRQSRSKGLRAGRVDGGEEAGEPEGHAHRNRSECVVCRWDEERDVLDSLGRMRGDRDTWGGEVDQGWDLEALFAIEQSRAL